MGCFSFSICTTSIKKVQIIKNEDISVSYADLKEDFSKSKVSSLHAYSRLCHSLGIRGHVKGAELSDEMKPNLY